MSKNETIILAATIFLAAICVVYSVDQNPLVLILISNVFAYMAGKKAGEGK